MHVKRMYNLETQPELMQAFNESIDHMFDESAYTNLKKSGDVDSHVFVSALKTLEDGILDKQHVSISKNQDGTKFTVKMFNLNNTFGVGKTQEEAVKNAIHKLKTFILNSEHIVRLNDAMRMIRKKQDQSIPSDPQAKSIYYLAKAIKRQELEDYVNKLTPQVVGDRIKQHRAGKERHNSMVKYGKENSAKGWID